jgi:hypothetical protein
VKFKRLVRRRLTEGEPLTDGPEQGSPLSVLGNLSTPLYLLGFEFVKHILTTILGYNVPELFLFLSMFCIPVSSFLRTLFWLICAWWILFNV